MEDTPHVMLAGAGAEQFAAELGIKIELLTDVSRRAWEQWRETSNYEPVINIENHDTIGILALDDQGGWLEVVPQVVWLTKCMAELATA